jgi:hypothetical protein
MRITWVRRVAAAMALAVVVAACGGGSSGPGSDPVGSVKGALDAMAAGKLDTLGQYACAAQQSSLPSLLGGSSAAGALPSGFGDIFSSMKITYDNLDVKQTNVTGDTATVHVTGTMKVTFDDAKMKEFIKQMLGASGQTVDDATRHMALAAMKSELGTGTAMDKDITLKNEGGKWLICSQ